MSAARDATLLELRAELGRLRYGVPLAEAGLSTLDLQVHAAEEAADLANYTLALEMRGDPAPGDEAIEAAIARARAEIARLEARGYTLHQACADLLLGADPAQVARRLGYADTRGAAEQIRKDGAR